MFILNNAIEMDLCQLNGSNVSFLALGKFDILVPLRSLCQRMSLCTSSYLLLVGDNRLFFSFCEKADVAPILLNILYEFERILHKTREHKMLMAGGTNRQKHVFAIGFVHHTQTMILERV